MEGFRKHAARTRGLVLGQLRYTPTRAPAVTMTWLIAVACFKSGENSTEHE